MYFDHSCLVRTLACDGPSSLVHVGGRPSKSSEDAANGRVELDAGRRLLRS